MVVSGTFLGEKKSPSAIDFFIACGGPSVCGAAAAAELAGIARPPRRHGSTFQRLTARAAGAAVAAPPRPTPPIPLQLSAVLHGALSNRPAQRSTQRLRDILGGQLHF